MQQEVVSSGAAVKLVSVKVFEVFSVDGTSLGLFKVADSWRGFTCLESLDKKSQMIVPTPTGDVFSDIFGLTREDARAIAVNGDVAKFFLEKMRERR